jgi:hypothetical protein
MTRSAAIPPIICIKYVCAKRAQDARKRTQVCKLGFSRNSAGYCAVPSRKQPEPSRASGQFTVESLSPHRVLKAGEERLANEREGVQDAEGDYVTRIWLISKKPACRIRSRKSG